MHDTMFELRLCKIEYVVHKVGDSSQRLGTRVMKCCLEIPQFEDIVIVIISDLANTAIKLNEQELIVC